MVATVTVYAGGVGLVIIGIQMPLEYFALFQGKLETEENVAPFEECPL